ncbi:hypothetical protein ACJ3XI_09515 [Litorimonas sp. RW-G-Af-16]|uniref:hypothetical protein n=1 Tax=Litorimonas sp. RW-G-Af-16 TaxID=3241168 RepID=UPI00390CBE2D
MTFRTIDIDTETLGATNASPSIPARHSRSRRRSAIMAHARTGSRIAGFGF